MSNPLNQEMLEAAGFDLAADEWYLNSDTMPSNLYTNARPASILKRTGLGRQGLSYAEPQVYTLSDPNSGGDVTQQVQDHLLNCYLIARGLKNNAWDNLVMRQCVPAIFPRGKYNITSPIVVPPHVDFTMLGVLLRQCPTGGPSTAMSWNGDSTVNACSNPYQPAIILTAASRMAELNLHCDPHGDDTRAGSGFVSGKHWGVATVTPVSGSGTWVVGDTITGGMPDRAPYKGFTGTVAAVDGLGIPTSITITSAGAYAFPPEMQKRVWTTANGFNQKVSGSSNDRQQVYDSGNLIGYGTDNKLVYLTATWAADFITNGYNYQTAARVVGDTLIGNARIHGVSRTLASTADYGGTRGATFMGLNHFFNSIEINGGYEGFAFNGCNDVFGNIANSVAARRGMYIYQCSNLNINSVITDSSISSSLIIDRSHVVTIPNFTLFWAESNRAISAQAPASSGYNIQIGTGSSAQPNNQLSINFTVENGGRGSLPGSPLAYLAYTAGSNLHFMAPNLKIGAASVNTADVGYLTHLARIGDGFTNTNRITGIVSNISKRLFYGSGLTHSDSCTFTGYIVSGVLTVVSVTSGTLAVGKQIEGNTNLYFGLHITATGTGTDGVGTYTLSYAGGSADVGSAGSPVTLTAAFVETSPRCQIDVSDGGTGICKSYGRYEIVGEGAPASTTGQHKAGKSSKYFDVINGNEYINAGTYTTPSWKLVTRAA